ncbi:MAG: metal-dependent transcriptional regulator [Candidatus Helarchaeota archaeon]
MSKVPVKSSRLKKPNFNKYQKAQTSLTEKEEEILEYLGKQNEVASDTLVKRLNLASLLNCSPAMVNKLLKKLEKKELISYKKYGAIKLTEKGQNVANSLIRKHRLAEALFVDLLGLSASEAHEFACKFEHILDEKLANQIEERLGHPHFCPHGHSIQPNRENYEMHLGAPLTRFAANTEVRITQIGEEETEFLRKLASEGIEVGVRIKVLGKSRIDKTLLIEVGGKIIPIGELTAAKLMGIPL